MAQKPWALESQLWHDITHFLESRNGTETMRLGILTMTWYHSQAGEQEWNSNHEPWNPSYDMISLTACRAGMAQKPWALESQLPHDITHFLESRNSTATMSLGIPAMTWYHSQTGEQEWHRNHQPWNPSYDMISLTSWRAGITQQLWALESQLPHDITYFLESRNGTATMSLGIPAMT